MGRDRDHKKRDHKKRRELRFVAKLSGANEVPPNNSKTTGQFYAIFKKDTLYYKLVLENIVGLTAAHIHLGQPGENGPVVATLYGEVGPSGPLCKVVIKGKIRSCDLLGRLFDKCIDALIDEILAGNTYVNAHTDEFPGGVVRGQIERDRKKKHDKSCSSSSSSSECESSSSSCSSSSSDSCSSSSDSCDCEDHKRRRQGRAQAKPSKAAKAHHKH